MTGFWLAMCHFHLGERDQAQATYIRAGRNWKAIAVMQPHEEDLIRSIWQDAKMLLGDLAGPPQSQQSL